MVDLFKNKKENGKKNYLRSKYNSEKLLDTLPESLSIKANFEESASSPNSEQFNVNFKCSISKGESVLVNNPVTFVCSFVFLGLTALTDR